MVGYVTLDEANQYIATHFFATDSLVSFWDSLSEEDQTVALLRSFESIEMLPFTGRKASKDQQNAFPRFPGTEVPANIKAAQIENAVALSDSSAVEDARHYQLLQQFGVTSYRIGNLSESLGTGTCSAEVRAAISSGLVSDKAIQLLLPYMRGGYSVQGERHRPSKKGCDTPWAE